MNVALDRSDAAVGARIVVSVSGLSVGTAARISWLFADGREEQSTAINAGRNGSGQGVLLVPADAPAGKHQLVVESHRKKVSLPFTVLPER